AIVDQKRHACRQRLLHGARRVHHAARVAGLVAQLHQGSAAGGHAARHVVERAPIGTFRVDKGIEAKIEHHTNSRKRRGPAASAQCEADARLVNATRFCSIDAPRKRRRRRPTWFPSSSRSSAISASPTTSPTRSPTPRSPRKSIPPPA